MTANPLRVRKNPEDVPPRLVTSDKFMQALIDDGVLRAEDRVRRVVIDLQAGCAAVMHVERYADERVLDVMRTAACSIEIRESSRR